MSRAFAAWAGASCRDCGLPALLHGARCDDDDGNNKRLPMDALQRDPSTGNCSPAGDARHASSSSSDEDR